MLKLPAVGDGTHRLFCTASSYEGRLVGGDLGDLGEELLKCLPPEVNEG